MQKKHKKTLHKKGFSLIELSIVILIVSILITGSLGISKTAINNSKTKVTKDRMDSVYQAFTNFLANNRRLPCPALITAAKGSAGYGNEAATPGTCTSTYNSSNAGNLVYGMVPIAALGLDPDMAEDGFGTKFTYVVDKRFTKQSLNSAATDGFEITQGVPNEAQTSSTDLSGIDVQGPPISPGPGNLLLSNRNGVLFLMSHGANKFNGFNATGTAQNGTSTVTDENSNSCNPCFTDGTASFDRIFLTSSTDPNFDDIALFKNKTQLVRDAGSEFIMCSPSEAQTASLTWITNGSYGFSVCSGTPNRSKTCGKYGVWSSAVASTCLINTSTSSSSSTEPSMVIYADVKANGVNGGNSGPSWITRVLNTEVYKNDPLGSFSLASNQITLQAGKYLIEAQAPAYNTDRHQARFQNITDGTTDILGTSSHSSNGNGVENTSSVIGVVSISSAKVFELQHRSRYTIGSGYGVEVNFGIVEKYSIVKITRLN